MSDAAGLRLCERAKDESGGGGDALPNEWSAVAPSVVALLIVVVNGLRVEVGDCDALSGE
jgi:hypothetical protein